MPTQEGPDVQLLWRPTFVFVNSNFVSDEQLILSMQYAMCLKHIAMMKRGLLLLLIFLGLLASSCYFIPSTRLAALLLTLGLSNQQLRPPTRWASISICWGGGWAVTIPLLLFSSSENAKVYGKRNFPYSEAAFYSSKLWGTQSEGKVLPNTLLNCIGRSDLYLTA